MSVFKIQVVDGKKFMVPVNNREEYMNIRNSEINRKADKPHMVQMNYSCLPNEDGTLRGSKKISTTVGMDIDEPIDTDFLLSKKDELGLLMFENSATKPNCGHIVFRRHPEMSQKENLQWASHILGVAYDQGAKDITRVFYTPADKLVFLDDEIFSIEEAESNKPGNSETLNSETLKPLPLQQASASSLTAFDLCVKEAGLKPQQLDLDGVRHNNLMAVLSVGVAKLMSREQLEAVVRVRMPVYSKEPECMALLNYFYNQYSCDKGFMNASLRNINAQAQATVTPDGSEEEEEDTLETVLNQGWKAPEMPKKVPRLVNLLVGNYDKKYREMLSLSALPVMSALASHYRARYLNGRVIGPQQFVAVIGRSGSGKGNATELYKEMVEYTLAASDAKEWEKVKENSDLRDRKANAKEKPAKYHPKLRLFETTSKTSILELQTNLGKNGMLLGQFSEVDGLSAATRTAYSDISVLLRKGWDGDWHRQFYMSDQSCNTYVQMNISLLMAGTVKAMLERMFSDSNTEGGLMQRFIPALVPKSKRTFRPPMQNYLSEEEKKERDNMLVELYQKDLALGEEVCVLDTPMTNRAIGKWFDGLEEKYNNGELTEAEADLSHRCGEFILRTAIPLIALNDGVETKEIVDFAVWVGEMALYGLSRLFGMRVQKNIQEANEMISERTDYRKTAEPLLDKLPVVFDLKTIKEERVRAGQSENVKALLSRYCKSGKLERLSRGVYRKLNN